MKIRKCLNFLIPFACIPILSGHNNIKVFFHKNLKEKCTKENNLKYSLEEFTYIFLPLEIKVSFFKPQKCIFSQLISRNETFGATFSVNF